MRALIYDGNLRFGNIDTPTPKDGESLIRVILAGICMTDMEIVRGYMNFHGVLGHEFVGLVEHSQNRNLIGKRVVGDINVGCGKCDLCRGGLERHCNSRSVLGIVSRSGAFAEYLTLPESNLHIVPDNVSDQAAVFVEPLAAALEILEQIHVQPQTRVLIIGDGRLGLLICMILRLTGCSITVIGKHSNKLEMFRRYSARTALLDDAIKVDHKFDLVVEASGNPSGWDTAIGLVKPRGVIALKSTYHGNLSFNPAPLVINEISVVGSRCGQFDPALRLLQSGLVDPLPLVSKIYSLSDSIRAFDHAGSSEVLKILIRM